MKDIVGYEGLYAVTEDGRVWSYRAKRFLKATSEGYQSVVLCKDKTQQFFQVHRLVAAAFIPNPLSLPCINHKDENPANNAVSNLEWCTHKYNNNYGGHNARCGKAHGRKVYSVELDKVFDSCADAARALGVTSACIWYRCKDNRDFMFLE